MRRGWHGTDVTRCSSFFRCFQSTPLLAISYSVSQFFLTWRLISTLEASESRRETARDSARPPGSHSSDTTPESVFFTGSPAPLRPPESQSRPRTRFYCTHCQKDGHQVDTCYQLHPEKKPPPGQGRFKKGRGPKLGRGSTSVATSTPAADLGMERALEMIRRNWRLCSVHPHRHCPRTILLSRSTPSRSPRIRHRRLPPTTWLVFQHPLV